MKKQTRLKKFASLLLSIAPTIALGGIVSAVYIGEPKLPRKMIHPES